ncbi:ClpP/crotonase-like domain-containing protein [Hyaloraphidium curvatum]|nr:ClpP/crotonase-like domain-containing protein [Hyaloraphidium curvatum]
MLRPLAAAPRIPIALARPFAGPAPTVPRERRVPKVPHAVRPLSTSPRIDLSTLGAGSVTLHLPTASSPTPGVAFIVLRNQKRRNAISGRMMVELSSALEELGRAVDRMERKDAGLPAADGKGFGDKDGEVVSAVVIAGEGGTWCAGFDLSSDRELVLTQAFARTMATHMHATLHKLRSLPLLTIAGVSGFAIGGGAELATAADFRVWSPGARLRFVQLKMGVVPGWGGATRLADLVGQRTALRLLCSAETVDAGKALALGLADHIGDNGPEIDVPGMEADPVARAAAAWAVDSFVFRDPPPPPSTLVGPEDFDDSELASLAKKEEPPRARNSPLALRSMKRSIATPERLAAESKGYERELEEFTQNWGSHYNLEAVQALRKQL